jgi:hypothetical protein
VRRSDVLQPDHRAGQGRAVAAGRAGEHDLRICMFNHMVAEGVECDAVTCCSLITALDKGGQWQLAEQVRHGWPSWLVHSWSAFVWMCKLCLLCTGLVWD